MNSSLRDQLLAAGLVTEKQARQAAQEQERLERKQQHSQGRGQPQGRGQGHGQSQGRGQPHGQGQGRGQSQGYGQARGRDGQAPAYGQPQGHTQTQGGGERQGHAQAQGGGERQGAAQTQGGGERQGAAQTQGGAEQQARAQTVGQQPQAPSAKLQAQQAQAAKIARDQELNRRREDKAARKARMAQIEQIVEQHRLPRLETEDYYSFIDGKKIRRMSVDAQRREQLTKRELVIVRYKGHYAVVPADIAERIRERDANMVVPYVQPPANAEVVDDAYKDFVVPDDLMW